MNDFSLIKGIINPIKIIKGSNNIYDIGRAGLRPSARENLYAGWGIRETDIEKAYGDENLKNTHGEKFHSDNDKLIENIVTSADIIDTYEEEYKNRERNMDRTLMTFSVDECLNDLIKADDIDDDDDDIDDEEVAEMNQVDKVIRNEKRRSEKVGKLEMSELDEVFNLVKGTVLKSSISLDIEDFSDEQLARMIEHGVHENSKVLQKKKSLSELDELVDMVKGSENKGIYPSVVRDEFPIIKKLPNHIKSIGKGGVRFDFGNHTGNPIADNYNAILSKSTEPIQEQMAEGQKAEYDKALSEYVEKGDEQYSKDHNVLSPDGAYQEKGDKDGIIEKSGKTGGVVETKTLNVGGEVVHAKSETDRYVLEMHENMFKSNDNDGQIIDATGGGSGGVVIDAISGAAFDVITGKEIKGS